MQLTLNDKILHYLLLCDIILRALEKIKYFWLLDNGLNIIIVCEKVQKVLKILGMKEIFFICGMGFYYY